MKTFLTLAWRNVWRNRRRTLINITAVVFALLITILMRSLQYGTYTAMESFAVSLFTGELQVYRAGFHDERTLNFHLSEQDSIWHWLNTEAPSVKRVARRIESFGLVSSDSTSTGAIVVGIEPEAEGEVTNFTRQRSLVAGAPLTEASSNMVLLGHALAKNSAVGPGDSVAIVTQGYRNLLGADLYEVRGLLKTGSAELDRMLVVMPLRAAQALFALEGRVTGAVVRIDDLDGTRRVAAELESKFRGRGVEVMTWEELLPELVQGIKLDNIAGLFFLTFLVLIAGFEIMNTAMMSVVERMREFGVLQSIGINRRKLGLLVMYEGLLKTGLALAIGSVLAFVMLALLSHQPIPLSESIKTAMAEYGLATDLYFASTLRVFAEPFLTILAVSLISMIYPMRIVMRLTPVQAMRRT